LTANTQTTQSKPRAFFARIKKKAKFHTPFFAIPYALLIVLFILIPLGIILVRSFMTHDGYFTFDNFAYFFSSSSIARTLGNSVLIAVLTTLGCLLLTYPIALVLSNSKFNKSAILVLLFILPMYVNFMLRTFAIRTLLDMLNIGASTAGATEANQLVRIVVAHIYDFFPFMLLPIYTCMINIDKSYAEASNDLGASSTKTFLRITLPLSMPGVISGVLMVFMPTLSMFAVRDLVVVGREWIMIGNIIYDLMGGGPAAIESNIGAAFSVILLTLVAAIMVGANRLSALSNKKQRQQGGAL